MTETIFGKIYSFIVAHAPSTNMKDREVGCMSYTAASHQGGFQMFWLHLWGAAMSGIFSHSVIALN